MVLGALAWGEFINNRSGLHVPCLPWESTPLARTVRQKEPRVGGPQRPRARPASCRARQRPGAQPHPHQEARGSRASA
jgi:hypothetical protein